MWLLKDVFAIDDKYLITSLDEKRGRLVLNEVMKGGNFGQYDDRWTKRLARKSTTLSIIMRNVEMLRLFPEEAIWAPVMGVWRHLRNNERS